MNEESLFTVKREWEWDYIGLKEHDTPIKKKKTGYTVELPHSCGEWVITDELDKTKAIEKMEMFIEEAEEALEKLKSL